MLKWFGQLCKVVKSALAASDEPSLDCRIVKAKLHLKDGTVHNYTFKPARFRDWHCSADTMFIRWTNQTVFQLGAGTFVPAAEVAKFTMEYEEPNNDGSPGV